PAVAVGDALPGLVGETEIAGRPGLDQHVLHVGDAAFRAGGAEPGVGLGGPVAFDELVEHDARLRPRHMRPALDASGCEIDDAVERPVAAGLIAADERLAARHVAAPEGAYMGLLRLVERDRLEPRGLVEPRLRAHDLDGPLDLRRRERIERMVMI